jgi:biopolymer transport protein ExbD
MAIKGLADNDGIISEINITPLTDVMLVLLIIFMVTATFFVAEPAMQVELPPAVTSELVTKEDGEITVIVKQDGAMTVNDRPTTEAGLTNALLEAARDIQAEKKVVLVRGDREATYGRVIWIMDAARLVGLRNVSLATEKPGAVRRGKTSGGTR